MGTSASRIFLVGLTHILISNAGAENAVEVYALHEG